MKRPDAAASPPRKSHWIPWTLAAGFAAVVLADAAMIGLAVRSDPGLVAGAPARLGTGNVLPPATGLRLEATAGRGGAAGSLLVEARLRDRDGRPARAASVTGVLQRATDARADTALAFAEAPPDASGPPAWRAVVPDLPRGTWDVALHAYDEEGRPLAAATLRLSP